METFGATVRRLRTERGISLREAARRAAVDPGHLSRIEAGHRPPTPQIARSLDTVLDADGVLVDLARFKPNAQPGDDELDALEFARRLYASDISASTIDALNEAVDRFAIAYPATPPAALIGDVRRYLRYVSELLDKRMTLTHHRELLTSAGWLSLLAATLHIDLHQRQPAALRLEAARSIADHVGHAEIAAWCLETRAWDAVTEGQYRVAVELSQGAERLAPDGSSAQIQATAQEGRARAKLGDRRATRGALRRLERLVSPLAPPHQPEHHYRYDPDKQLAYTATTLAWLGDPAAVDCARDVVARFDPVVGGTRPRRAAAARLDLALALVSTGRPDEATGHALEAVASGRIVASNAWRVGEILEAVERAGVPEAAELREASTGLVDRTP